MVSKNGSTASTDTDGRDAREFDPDRPVWERQPTETDGQWKAFQLYLHSDRRRIAQTGVGNIAYRYSTMWSWGYRVLEWDNHQVRQELEVQSRSRVAMNARHRKLAGMALHRVEQWIHQVDPKKLTATEATRLLDVAARLEREANGGNATLVATSEVQDLPDAPHEPSFEERVSAKDLAVDLRDLAKLLNRHVPKP